MEENELPDFWFFSLLFLLLTLRPYSGTCPEAHQVSVVPEGPTDSAWIRTGLPDTGGGGGLGLPFSSPQNVLSGLLDPRKVLYLLPRD